MKMLGMFLFLALLSLGLSTLAPRAARCQGSGCPVGEKCVTDYGCRMSVCNLRCVGVKRSGVGPKYCTIVVPQEH